MLRSLVGSEMCIRDRSHTILEVCDQNKLASELEEAQQTLNRLCDGFKSHTGDFSFFVKEGSAGEGVQVPEESAPWATATVKIDGEEKERTIKLKGEVDAFNRALASGIKGVSAGAQLELALRVPFCAAGVELEFRRATLCSFVSPVSYFYNWNNAPASQENHYAAASRPQHFLLKPEAVTKELIASSTMENAEKERMQQDLKKGGVKLVLKINNGEPVETFRLPATDAWGQPLVVPEGLCVEQEAVSVAAQSAFFVEAAVNQMQPGDTCRVKVGKLSSGTLLEMFPAAAEAAAPKAAAAGEAAAGEAAEAPADPFEVVVELVSVEKMDEVNAETVLELVERAHHAGKILIASEALAVKLMGAWLFYQELQLLRSWPCAGSQRDKEKALEKQRNAANGISLVLFQNEMLSLSEMDKSSSARMFVDQVTKVAVEAMMKLEAGKAEAGNKPSPGFKAYLHRLNYLCTAFEHGRDEEVLKADLAEIKRVNKRVAHFGAKAKVQGPMLTLWEGLQSAVMVLEQKVKTDIKALAQQSGMKGMLCKSPSQPRTKTSAKNDKPSEKDNDKSSKRDTRNRESAQGGDATQDDENNWPTWQHVAAGVGVVATAAGLWSWWRSKSSGR
eukprot:TRINITY_DN2586_c0_g2_i3.p1 TRINITY_DN2586_c0_g2~~TRINITY_DN2586_c0_g2_i3.p1  ORF type:complete len:618 (-),score=199.65 TRINITY_DN2586_c0_g2_i3:390-2243(-)